MSRRLLSLVGCLCVLSLTSCAGSSPTAEVSGQVKYDGKLLPDGEILFYGQDGKAPEQLVIKDGSFSGRVTVGKKRVEINAYRPGTRSETDEPGAEPPKENYIPAQYSSESTLAEEIRADRPNTFTYDLKKI